MSENVIDEEHGIVTVESSIKCSDTKEDNPSRPQHQRFQYQQVMFEEHSADGNGMVGDIQPVQNRALISLLGVDSESSITKGFHNVSKSQQHFIREEHSSDSKDNSVAGEILPDRNNPNALDEENGIPNLDDSPIKSTITDEAHISWVQQKSEAEDATCERNGNVAVATSEPIRETTISSFKKIQEDAAPYAEHLPGKQRVRRRLKPGFSGFIPNSFSKHFASTHPINELTYDGGSLKHIRLRRDDLNFQKLFRRKNETRPMPSWDRWKIWMNKRFRRDGHNAEKSTQINIPPYNDGSKSLLSGLGKLGHLAFHDATIWLINTTYTNFFLVQFLCYYILIILFAFILWGAATAYYYHPAKKLCISNMEFDKSHSTQNFEYAFEASWTSFSTVGFGVVAPTNSPGCVAVRILCSFEAAVGILYFGFAGAIFFARVSQVLYRAPVTFSSTLCIQYDAGQTNSDWSGPLRPLEMSDVSKMISSPLKFPSLEFRIVHNKSNYKGWEILNVSLNCMVAIDVIALSSSVENKGLSVLFDFEVTGDDAISRKQTYHKVQLEAESHPYFKRVWHCQHILNDHSPLLTTLARKEISDLGGWPPHRTNPLGIRSALKKFKTLIITFQGTSNMTSRNVFVEHRYRYEDIFIGWKFAPLIYLEKPASSGDRYAKVDLSLIHDIQPQNDGGEERLDSEHLSPPVSRHRRVKTTVFES